MFYDGVEISPVGRDENGIGVWWGEQKIALAAPPLLTKNSDNLPFQRMTSTEDRYLLWKRVMVGNLSSDRLTESITTDSWQRWRRAISDRRVLRLIRSFLTAGVLNNGLVEASWRGDPARRSALAIAFRISCWMSWIASLSVVATASCATRTTVRHDGAKRRL